MSINILTATQNPVEVISLAAGTSYGKSDVSEKRVQGCYTRRHMSVFEHASVTFKVDGISRACSHQLVRHRLASMVQKSQRYTKVDASEGIWFVRPPSFNAGNDDPVLTMERDEFFYGCMNDAAMNYQYALKAGIKPEDARYLLPEAAKTELTVTMNVRELYHFLELRTDSHAQWEIRDMANELIERVKELGDQWEWLIGLWEVDHERD